MQSTCSRRKRTLSIASWQTLKGADIENQLSFGLLVCKEDSGRMSDATDQPLSIECLATEEDR